MRRGENWRSALVLGLAATLALSLVACTKQTERKPTVTSAWPVAYAERVVQKPAGPARWPLTGLPAPNAGAPKARVLSVKIENSPAARPQTALNKADVVYESLAEGGITRFNAIFHSQMPKLVGPVRSARISDSYVVPQYNALFFFSGASGFVTRALKQAGLPLLSEDAGVTRVYERSSSRPRPHNLYLKAQLAREEGKRRGYPVTQNLRPFTFDRRTLDSTVTVTRIDVPFSPSNRTTWTYDPRSKTYVRETNGVRHMDAETGQQVRTKNVVVMWAPMRSTGHPDKNGNPTYDIVLSGKNRVAVFHDGQQLNGVWIADKKSPPVFKTDSGTIIKLALGNSWFEVIPTSTNISLK